VIRLLLCNPQGRERLFPFLVSKIFHDQNHAKIVDYFIKFHEKYDKFPTKSELKIFIKEETVYNELVRCSELDISEYNDEFVMGELESWFKEKMIHSHIVDAVQALTDQDLEKLSEHPDNVREALSFSFDTKLGLDFFDDAESLYNSLHDEDVTFSTGLYDVDKLIDGGLHEKSITLFLAETNMGKTLIQSAIATNCLLQNKNVLYITFEESEKKLSRRFMANLFDVNMGDLKLLRKEKFLEKFDKCKKVINNQLIIREYPENTISANHLRTLIKELKTKKKFVPDVIFVDYIGCMIPNGRPNSNINSNDVLRLVCGQTRALSMEFGPPVVSAMQANRGGMKTTDLDLTDSADSIGQTFKADIIFGVTQTAEMKAAGRYSFSLLKNRYGINKRKRFVGVDFNKMRLYDVEQPGGNDADKNNNSTEELIDQATVTLLKSKTKSRSIARKKVMIKIK